MIYVTIILQRLAMCRSCVGKKTKTGFRKIAETQGYYFFLEISVAISLPRNAAMINIVKKYPQKHSHISVYFVRKHRAPYGTVPTRIYVLEY